jgi:hypothetical protein
MGINGGSGGTGAGGTAGSDAGTVTCTSSMRFGDSVPVYGLNRDPGNEYRVFLSPDELTAYISHGHPWQVADIAVAKRASRSEPFGNALALAEINSPSSELSVSLTPDALTLFVESSRSGTGRIYAATRRTILESFSPPTAVPLDHGEDAEGDPYVLPDGSALYYGVAYFAPATNAIWRVSLEGITPRSPTVIIDDGDVRWPVVSADELVLYYYDTAPSGSGGGIVMRTRTSIGVPFGEPTELTELNTPDVEWPQWISPDGCRLYFGRGTANGAFLFVAERVRN